MNEQYSDRLVCPICRSKLGTYSEQSTEVICILNGHSFAIVNGIPRFVSQDNYAESFGFQWNTFRSVQLDSFNGTKFSEERFLAITNWTKQELMGKLVLDAGCGAGRFSEVVLKYGGELAAFDLSNAVDAWKKNLAKYRAFVCQASIYEIPFPPETFDFVYCIGVIQHTPDPLATIRALCRMVKPGGQIGLWIYEHNWKSYIGTVGFKYLLRPIFSRLNRSKQFSLVGVIVRIFLPIALVCKQLGIVGKIIMRLLPISSAHLQSVPLNKEDFKTWVLLDTFDMYSPEYDQPQTYTTIANLLDSEKFENIQRQPHGGISITATRRR